jgi:hypothetical protein
VEIDERKIVYATMITLEHDTLRNARKLLVSKYKDNNKKNHKSK